MFLSIFPTPYYFLVVLFSILILFSFLFSFFSSLFPLLFFFFLGGNDALIALVPGIEVSLPFSSPPFLPFLPLPSPLSLLLQKVYGGDERCDALSKLLKEVFFFFFFFFFSSPLFFRFISPSFLLSFLLSFLFSFSPSLLLSFSPSFPFSFNSQLLYKNYYLFK